MFSKVGFLPFTLYPEYTVQNSITFVLFFQYPVCILRSLRVSYFFSVIPIAICKLRSLHLEKRMISKKKVKKVSYRLIPTSLTRDVKWTCQNSAFWFYTTCRFCFVLALLGLLGCVLDTQRKRKTATVKVHWSVKKLNVSPFICNNLFVDIAPYSSQESNASNQWSIEMNQWK